MLDREIHRRQIVTVAGSLFAFCLLCFSARIQCGVISPLSKLRDGEWFRPARASETSPTGDHVGINLAPSLGTLAIAFANGTTVVDVADGNDAYRETMAQLADPVTRAPPDRLEGIKRSFRKSLGLPASPIAGVLSTVLVSLRDQAAPRWSARIPPVLLSAPHLASLYEDDVVDACEYAGLTCRPLPPHYHRPILYETAAAYAGYGFGLCKEPSETAACRDEELGFNLTTVLAVHYGRTALTTSLAVVARATYVNEPDYRRTANFALGSNDEEADGYWEKVAAEIQAVMAAFPLYAKPTKVLLMGESAGDSEFRRVMTDALERVMGNMPPIYGNGGMSVAAKGAAELARRGELAWADTNARASAEGWVEL